MGGLKFKRHGPLILVVTAAAAIMGYLGYFILRLCAGHWLLTSKGGLGATDFTAFWCAGRLAALGRSASAYSWTGMAPLLGPASGHFAAIASPFFYPPSFLLFLRPLAALAPGPAVACWIIGGLLAYLMAAWTVLPRVAALMTAAAAPAVFSCLCMGQNGLLTAACLAGGLALLDRRPLLAGALIGLLSCKPQLGILIPFALAASGRWTVVAAAGCAVLALALASLGLFGWSAWAAFITANHHAQGLVEALIHKGQGLYAFLRLCGAPIPVAWGAQAAASLACVTFVVFHWRSGQPLALKAAGLIGATLLASPYSFAYDLPVTALATLFIAADGARRSLDVLDRVALFLVLVMPVVVLCPALVAAVVVAMLLTAKARPRGATIGIIAALILAVPILTVIPVFCGGPVICLLLLCVVSRRWVNGAAPASFGAPVGGRPDGHEPFMPALPTRGSVS